MIHILHERNKISQIRALLNDCVKSVLRESTVKVDGGIESNLGVSYAAIYRLFG